MLNMLSLLANLLFYVTIAEVVGVLMAVIPVLSHKFEVMFSSYNSIQYCPKIPEVLRGGILRIDCASY